MAVGGEEGTRTPCLRYAKIAEQNRHQSVDRQVDPIPMYDPRDCRHTAASCLAQDGVPLSDIQKLLRHEKGQTTERYAHLLPDAHDRVEASWKRILPAQTHQRRTGQGLGQGMRVDLPVPKIHMIPMAQHVECVGLLTPAPHTES